MRLAITVSCFFLFCAIGKGQNIGSKWYSEFERNGVIIQNSFPKGGPYTGPTNEHFNYSYLVFYTRVMNDTEYPMELAIRFSADSIPIPNAPNTFVKIFLPPDTMTLEKRDSFSYGVTRLASFDQPTSFQQVVNPKEDCLFYTVAIFYQTEDNIWGEERGGNRAEFNFNGEALLFNLLPQIDAMPAGHILFKQ